MKIQTKLIKAVHTKQNPYSAITTPIFLASTYAQGEINKPGEFEYQRGKNPTTKAFEDSICAVFGASYAHATASGMGAITLALSLLKTGQKVLFCENIYGGTFRYAKKIMENIGIKYELRSDLESLESLSADVGAIYIETPSNPLLNITDIKKIVALAHANNAIVIADNTFMPLFQSPLALGVDVELHSATKFIGGHGDSLGGVVCTNDKALGAKIGSLKSTLGIALAPFDSYLMLRGLKTMKLRFDAQIANTKKILEFLKSHEAVQKLYFAGGASEHERVVHEAQAGGCLGAVLSFEMSEKYCYERFASSLELFDIASSLGGVESLICHPATMSHASYGEQLRAKIGIKDNLLRLAIGCEDGEDLIADLAKAFAKAKKS